MRTVTKHHHSFPGDKSILVSLKCAAGAELGIFNITPHRDRQGTYYTNDDNGHVFPTVRAACQWVLDHAGEYWPEVQD